MMNNFLGWLDAHGAIYYKLKVQQHTDTYRSVVSNDTIDRHERIMMIPHKLLITLEKARDNGTTNQICDDIIDCEHTFFATYLLEEKEKGADSFWYPYISTLPQTYKNMAVFFDDDQMRLLRGSFTVKKILFRRETLKRDYENICRACPDFERFSLEDFIWGRMATITRIFSIDVDGKTTSALVPLADMLNHKVPDKSTGLTDTHWTYDQKRGGFVIVSNKNIKQGREIYDSYGYKCNSRFFVNYGFTVMDNQDDDETSMIFYGKEFSVPGFYRDTRERQPKTQAMFEYIRKNISHLSGLDREIELLKKVKDEAVRRSMEFGHTIEEYSIMIDCEHDWVIRDCYVMCYSELKVLAQYINLSNTLVPKLLNGDYKKILDKKGRPIATGNSLIDEYVRDLLAKLIQKDKLK
jgi:hypothetical protein